MEKWINQEKYFKMCNSILDNKDVKNKVKKYILLKQKCTSILYFTNILTE